MPNSLKSKELENDPSCSMTSITGLLLDEGPPGGPKKGAEVKTTYSECEKKRYRKKR